MGLRTFSTGVGIVAASIAILANFRNASTELVQLWPIMASALPLLGLGGMFGGLTLVGGCVWKWHVARRPEPPPSSEEGFRQLAPDIMWWVEIREEPVSTDFRQQAEVGTRYMRTKDALTALGVTLPKESEDCVRMIIMAERGKLAEARRLFPLQPKDEGPAVSD